ncbi:terminase small subunit [Metabacillus sp. GX 13764]|uniref:terminase small subunit n=1 Tax=Metabacillus kandeliae TaxID=2900151 RepID=UPI001E4A0E3D|nr:terminase small subunit [Metabacillus kandeliae]MCD7034318.1 terminase small subunit [Metabacillus kandeliae]
MRDKHKQFADLYIELGNATEAYQRVYKCQRMTADANGTKLLGNARIKEYIAERVAKKDKEVIAGQDEVLQYLTKVMRGETTEKVLVGAGKGYQEQEDMEVSAKDRIKAAELLGKRYTLWTDAKKLEGNLGVTILDDIADED